MNDDNLSTQSLPIHTCTCIKINEMADSDNVQQQ